MALLSPSGGLVYHLRALEHADVAWVPFREAVATWLLSWSVPTETLLLIGPSAGYCLDDRFLSRFQQLVVLDPDPLAERLFRRRHPAAPRPQWLRVDHFTNADSVGLTAVLSAHLDAALLFCNFLGQLPLLLPAARAEETLAFWRHQLPVLLQGRHWASFHDRLSGELSPVPFDQPAAAPRRLSDEELLDRFYGGQDGELVDHRTDRFFQPDLPHHYFRWALTNGQHHLVEGVCSALAANCG